MKKIILVILLVSILAMAFAVPAFADPPKLPGGNNQPCTALEAAYAQAVSVAKTTGNSNALAAIEAQLLAYKCG